MPKQSLAHELIEYARRMPEKRDRYLIVYDFEGSQSIPRFYDNLREVLSELDGALTQRSVVQTKSYRCAWAVMALADHYDAKVRGFKVSSI